MKIIINHLNSVEVNPPHHSIQLSRIPTMTIDIDFEEFENLSDVISEVGEDAILDEIDNDDIANYANDNTDVLADIDLEKFIKDIDHDEVLDLIIKKMGEQYVLEHLSEETHKALVRDLIVDDLIDED